MKCHRLQNGFTLVELLVVVTIIGILTTISYNYYRAYKFKSYVSVVIAENKNLFTAAVDYVSHNESVTNNNSVTTTLCSGLSACQAIFPQLKLRQKIGDIDLLGITAYYHPTNRTYVLTNYFKSDTLDYIGCEMLEVPTSSTAYSQNCTMLFEGNVETFRN